MGAAVFVEGSRVLARVRVVAAEAVEPLPWWRRLWRGLLTALA